MISEESELQEKGANTIADIGGLHGRVPHLSPSTDAESPAASCSACGGAFLGTSYVYVIGRIQPRFPRISVDKEFLQAAGRAQTTGLTDAQALHAVLSKQENRYLVRQLCWILTVENLETYILVPRDPADYYLLVDALRATPSPTDLDVVIGVRGPIASTEMCNGLLVPIIAFDQIYSFDRQTLIKSIPRKGKAQHKVFSAAAEELLDRILQLTDNAGVSDAHRALNYLAVRYPGVYAAVVDAHERNRSLSSVDVRLSPLSGVRRIVDAIFSFTDRTTDVVEKVSVRVDVTDEFPFLVTKLSPYYDR